MVSIPMIKPLHRRTFLRGLGGIAVGLPVLELMLDRHGEALAAGGSVPCRFFVGFHGQAMGGDGDPEPDRYRPSAFGPDYDLKDATMPLGNYGDVRQQVSIISNLRIPYNNSGPGSWNNAFHLGALPPLLCGVSNPDDSSYCRGVTADQVVADAIGADTKFASGLQYQVQPSWYLTDSAPYGRDVISYKSDGGGGVVGRQWAVAGGGAVVHEPHQLGLQPLRLAPVVLVDRQRRVDRAVEHHAADVLRVLVDVERGQLRPV